MQLSLISLLAVVAAVIALPVLKMSLDDHAEEEKNLETRQSGLVSWGLVLRFV